MALETLRLRQSKGFRGFEKGRESSTERYSLGIIYSGVLFANRSCPRRFGSGKELEEENKGKRRARSLPKVDPMLGSG